MSAPRSSVLRRRRSTKAGRQGHCQRPQLQQGSVERYLTDERVYEQAKADGVIEQVGSFFAEGAFVAAGAALHVVPALVGIVIGCLLVVLALFTALGHNWARAVAWILCVPALIRYGALTIFYIALPSLLGPGPVEPTPPDLVDPTSRELTQRYEQAWPGWLDMLDTVLMISVPLVLLTALVSQTMPTVDAYFRLRRRRTANGPRARSDSLTFRR